MSKDDEGVLAQALLVTVARRVARRGRHGEDRVVDLGRLRVREGVV